MKKNKKSGSLKTARFLCLVGKRAYDLAEPRNFLFRIAYVLLGFVKHIFYPFKLRMFLSAVTIRRFKNIGISQKH